MKLLTDRELTLAAEYEAPDTDPGRRDAIRRELCNLRRRLDEDSARKFHTTGKGRRDSALCEGRTVLTSARRSRFMTASKLHENILPKELAHTLPTLKAIMRNANDRLRSIRELAVERRITFAAAKKKYYAERKKLLNFFAP